MQCLRAAAKEAIIHVEESNFGWAYRMLSETIQALESKHSDLDARTLSVKLLRTYGQCRARRFLSEVCREGPEETVRKMELLPEESEGNLPHLRVLARMLKTWAAMYRG